MFRPQLRFAVTALQLFSPDVAPIQSVCKHINEFLILGSDILEVYTIKDTIRRITSLEYMWFREFHMSIDKCKKYSIEASLPWILTKSMLSYININCTVDIFLPLEIYADSAQKALGDMKSQYLYDEIKAESLECLRILSSFIANLLYRHAVIWDSIWTLRSIDIELTHLTLTPSRPLSFFYPIIFAKPFTFLGRSVCASELIGSSVNEELVECMSNIISLIERSGLRHIRILSRAMKVAKSVYCTFQQQLQLMPYPDLLRSADSLQKLPNGKIHTAVVREILSSAIAIVCDTCSGVDRVSDNTRLIEEIQIEKDILKLVELSPCPQVFKFLHDANPELVTYEHYDSIVQICGFATTCNIVADIRDAIIDDICSFIEMHMGLVVRSCPKMPKLPLADYGCVASYHYYNANLQKISSCMDLMSVVIPLMRRLGNVIIAVKHIDEALERSKLTRIFQEAYISDQKNPMHNLLLGALSEIGYEDGEKKTNEILNSIQRIKSTREEFSLFSGFLKSIEQRMHKSMENILNDGKKGSCITISPAWSIVQFIICSDMSMNNKDVAQELGECISWLGCVIVKISKEVEIYRQSDILGHILKIHSLNMDSTHKIPPRRQSEKRTGTTSAMDIHSKSHPAFKNFISNARYICSVNERVMDIVSNSLT